MSKYTWDQCRRKTFMGHQTLVWWSLYIPYKFVKSPIRHLGLAIGNVWRVRRISPTLWDVITHPYPNLKPLWHGWVISWHYFCRSGYYPCPDLNHGLVNSLLPGDGIWQHRSGSTLVQVMACCLTAPSHYLNQCWLFICEVQGEQFHKRYRSHQSLNLTWK